MKVHQMPIFVINLESQRERKSHIVRQFKGSSLKPTLIAAHDGHDPDFPFSQYRHLAGRFWDDESEFKPGAFCCYLSHAECWRKIAAGEAEFGLVLEDDVENKCSGNRRFLGRKSARNGSDFR